MKRTQGVEHIIKNQMDYARKKYGNKYFDISIDENYRGRFNASAPLIRMVNLIKDIFSSEPNFDERVDYYYKRAEELFVEKLGSTLQEELNRLVKTCVKDAIRDSGFSEDVLQRFNRAMDDEAVLD
ncbi:MAG: hypothetical protein HOP19_27345, partial [Acidobacteria bacterium]|nr:hypothetical protein [Acidobacteriota bacterium]